MTAGGGIIGIYSVKGGEKTIRPLDGNGSKVRMAPYTTRYFDVEHGQDPGKAGGKSPHDEAHDSPRDASCPGATKVAVARGPAGLHELVASGCWPAAPRQRDRSWIWRTPSFLILVVRA